MSNEESHSLRALCQMSRLQGLLVPVLDFLLCDRSRVKSIARKILGHPMSPSLSLSHSSHGSIKRVKVKSRGAPAGAAAVGRCCSGS